jgi:hypothetical protein
MNAQPELFEDLIDLDSFAKAIYTVAKYDLKQDSGVTDFMRAINKKNSVIFNGDIFSKAHNQTPLERADRLHGEEYNSHSEFFTDRLAFA